MKKQLSGFVGIISLLLIGGFILSDYSPALAQKKDKAADKQGNETALNEGIASAKETINILMKKVYSGSLFSPNDNNKLIELKMKLYDLWSENPTNKVLAKPMYDTAIILKDREMYDEAKEFLNIIIENFPPSEEESTEEEGAVPSVDYSAKAQATLKKLLKDHPDK